MLIYDRIHVNPCQKILKAFSGTTLQVTFIIKDE